jgi:hypothetical protein
MARYRVTAGTQVHHDGTTYGPGEVLEAPEPVARPWVLSGYVTALERAKRTARAK